MWRFIIKNAVLSFVFLILIVFVLYLLQAQFQGDPFKGMLGEPDGEVHHREVMIAHGLMTKDGHIVQPIVRLGHWIRDVFHGNWGLIYTLQTDASTVPGAIFKPLRTSMLVAIPAYILGTLIGLVLGFVCGYKRGKITDTIIIAFVSLFISIPSFVLAAFTILIGPKVGLPTSFEDALGTTYMVRTIILPIILITLISLSGWTYRLRVEIGAILTSDYILAARTKGYSEFFIFRRYVLRNALYPFAGSLAIGFMAALSSSIITERFFNIPGSTTQMISAAKAGEINMIMASTLIFGVISIFTQIISNAAQYSINPIVKSSFASSYSPWKKAHAFWMRLQEKRRMVVKND